MISRRAWNRHRFGAMNTALLLGAGGLAVGIGACGPRATPAAAPESGAASGAVVLGAGPSVKQMDPAPPLRHNQVGYLPRFSKHAVLVTADAAPVSFQLEDAAGKVLLSGAGKPFGEDADSGDRLQQLDFSGYTAAGEGLRLRAGGEVSSPFAVSPSLYQPLVRDAFKYFYHNRSGIAIELPYAVEAHWTRPAGHLSDRSVPCAADAGCDYSLDVSGGWYDAGDHGKYVVNGGISVWTLLNLYERMAHFAPASLEHFGDGKLGIPEHGNQIPDLLDEARWEIDWMLKMQVPEGKPLAGMVHHKMHDEKWTSVGTRPPTDVAELKLQRILRPVSTAATLNLAAAAAQAARIWKPLDADFSARCLTAAERAYAAALANPKLLAKDSDSTGGGPYGDQQVDDEFYWAAAELFITTGKPEYREAIQKSRFHHHVPSGGDPTPMTWQAVSALGTISLAVVPSQLEAAEVKRSREEIRRLAREYLALRDRQGYRIPYAANGGRFPWGSNSFVLNNTLILGLANDFFPDRQYVDGMVDAMGYLLGNNPMGFSYVSGYGVRSLQAPHHRFWARALGPAFPPPAPGAVSGGPNSSLQDPTAQDAGLRGCRPMKCYLDHIDAWSVNEITINWNAPLLWVAAYLDEQGRTP